MAHFGKKVKNYRQHCFVAHIFKKNPLFELFQLLDAQENRFWGLGTFLAVCLVKNVTDLFTIWKMFHKLSLMLHKSSSYILSRQYSSSPFS